MNEALLAMQEQLADKGSPVRANFIGRICTDLRARIYDLNDGGLHPSLFIKQEQEGLELTVFDHEFDCFTLRKKVSDADDVLHSLSEAGYSINNPSN